MLKPSIDFKKGCIMAEENLAPYELGAKDLNRPWGTWEVIEKPIKDSNVVKQCEKRIVVYPHKMLSLQMHEGREEIWRVEEGTLTVCLNDQIIELQKGEEIHIPFHAIHAMVNLTGQNVSVYERQTGNCREEDNLRLMDDSGRPTVTIDHPHLNAAKQNYANLMQRIAPKALSHRQKAFSK